MFGLFRAARDVKEKYIMLNQYFNMLSKAVEVGIDPVSVTRKNELFEFLYEKDIFDEKTIGFRSLGPMDGFSWDFILSNSGDVMICVSGYGKYAGFSLHTSGIGSKFLVSVKDGIRFRATKRAMLLKAHFAADGALDTTGL